MREKIRLIRFLFFSLFSDEHAPGHVEEVIQLFFLLLDSVYYPNSDFKLIREKKKQRKIVFENELSKINVYDLYYSWINNYLRMTKINE
jgi:spore coat polysaccharide biosynthesis predicted glycosyltransferase SpsG